jgi:hypothetical protein
MPQFLTSNKTTPDLSGSAFWDIDLSRLDFERYADFTIVRVFERGTPTDISKILAYYGNTYVIESLTKATSLTPRAIALGEKILGIAPNRFACSKKTPRAMSCSMY